MTTALIFFTLVSLCWMITIILNYAAKLFVAVMWFFYEEYTDYKEIKKLARRERILAKINEKTDEL